MPEKVPEVHVTSSVATADHLADSEARSKCMEIQQDLVDHIWGFPKNGGFTQQPIGVFLLKNHHFEGVKWGDSIHHLRKHPSGETR